MFFKRRNKEKPTEAADASQVEKRDDGPSADSAGASSQGQGIAADALRRSVEASSFGFKTTADLEPEEGPFAQDRALADLDFGLRMRGRDFNIFVLGPPGAGKRTAVLAHLSKAQREATAPADWVYVQSFDEPHRLRALKFPAGRAPLLAERVAAAVRELRATLPAAFDAEDYRVRHRAIEEDYRSAHDDALDALHAKAADQNIAVLRTPLGFGMAPMHDGQVVKPEVFNQLPQVMRRDVESRVVTLQSELEAILTNAPAVDKERRRQLAALHAETARHPIEAALDDVSQDFADVPEATAFLADMERDLIANAQAFLSSETQDACVRRYVVHVVVTHAKDAGSSVVYATEATPASLIGTIGPVAECAAPAELRIRAGALHSANGGMLVIDARCLLGTRDAWDTLKCALKTGEIRLGSGSWDADPIPLDAKVILLGTHHDYEHLEAADADFGHLFKVRACFDQTMPRSAVNDNRLARLTASIVKSHALKPFDAGGVARLIEESSRIAGHRDKVTLNIGQIVDLAREADFWSKHAGRDVTTAEDVARAISERTQRADRVRERTGAQSLAAPIPDNAAGTKSGHAIALSTVEARGVRFAQAHRVAARVHAGRGRVADIVRTGAADGCHTAILRSYLASTFARDIPLAFAGTLSVDPPLSGVVENGIALSQLVALLSALAEQPLRQDVAVTGLVDQWGDVQPVDGINEQIEGFFDACQAHGLSGLPAVIIPEANRDHLMLSADVVEAVRNGRFVVHTVKTIGDALTLMADREAGARGADGKFAAETVNARVEAKLRAFAEAQRAFGHGADKITGAREGRA